jgi:hypothetical protein
MKKIKLLKLLAISFIAILFVSCEVDQVKILNVNKTSASLILGQTDSLKSTITISGNKLKFIQEWSTTDEKIVTVSNGQIKGIKAGTAIVTVTAGDKSASCTVVVTDKLTPVFTKGILEQWGTYYTDTSNDNILILFNSTDTLSIEVNTAPTVIDSIPSGIYQMVTSLNLNNFDQFQPKTLLPAFIFSGSYYGSWFYNKEIFTPVVQGNLTNKRGSNNVYSIQYNLFDYYGNTITGTFTGPLTVSNKISSLAPAAAPRLINRNPKNKFGSLKLNGAILRK